MANPKKPVKGPPPKRNKNQDRAREEFRKYGTTLEQSTGYMPGLSQLLFMGIDPAEDYYSKEQVGKILRDFVPNLRKGRIDPSDSYNNILNDAWRLYLGLPQIHYSFEPSKYTPSISSDPNAQYWRAARDTNGPDLFSWSAPAGPAILDSFDVRYYLDRIKNSGVNKIILTSPPLNEYTVSNSVDEQGNPYISYYDKWDLAPRKLWGEGSISLDSIIGKPFEVYDRIYYDPVTFEPLVEGPPLRAPKTKKSRGGGW